MIQLGYILGAGLDRDLLSFLILLIVGVIFALAKVLEKKMQKETERRAEAEREQREATGQEVEPFKRSPRARPERQPTVQRSAPGGHPPREERVRGVPPGPVPSRRVRLPYEIAPEPSPRPAPSEPVKLERPAPPPPPARRPAPSAPTRVTAQTVEEEIRRLQARLRRLDELRSRTLTVTAKPEPRPAAKPARPIVPAPPGLQEPLEKLPEIVDLVDPDKARRAIIFYEVLSPPKAIRAEREMWSL